MSTKQKAPTQDSVFIEYEKGKSFNEQIHLDDIVEQNENFYNDKQWEGVQANGLTTPQISYSKRTLLFAVATTISDNIHMQASTLAVAPDQDEAERVAQIVTNEFESIFEYNKIPSTIREYARDSAVDGDGCIFTYWDPDVQTGQMVPGAITSEIIDNTRVFFGNPNERHAQKQPYIIIEKQELLDDIKYSAEKNGVSNDNISQIQPDSNGARNTPSRLTDGKCTVLLRLWKSRDTGTIWACECVRNVMIRKPWDLKIRRYPITWFNWESIKDCYHGQAMMTGMIDNQKAVNKLYAMVITSISQSAFPKTVYDKTRIHSWNNQVGAAIGINGGDVSQAAKILEPAQISPQVSQFIDSFINYSQSVKGATKVALGDTRPDNTSAIVALQKAASAPNEITKQNLYASIEEYGQICLEFMIEYYGIRIIKKAKIPAENQMMQEQTQEKVDLFDFSSLRKTPMLIKLDVGASSYYNEAMTQTTLDNLLRVNNPEFSIVDYIERIPSDRFPQKQAWLDKTKLNEQMQMQMQQQQQGNPMNPNMPVTGQAAPIPQGAGFSQLQREIVKQGV
jgi:hypothetical protein